MRHPSESGELIHTIPTFISSVKHKTLGKKLENFLRRLGWRTRAPSSLEIQFPYNPENLPQRVAKQWEKLHHSNRFQHGVRTRQPPRPGDGHRHPGLVATRSSLARMRAPPLQAGSRKQSGFKSRWTRVSEARGHPRRPLRRHRQAKCLGPPLQPRLPRRPQADPYHMECLPRSGLRRLSLLEALESGIRWRRWERELLLTPEVPRLLSQRLGR